MIVAINKCDLPAADPNKVRTDLLQHNVIVEAMSGEVLDVEVSAVTRQGLDTLVDNIVLQAELQDLKANPDRPAAGAVIAAGLLGLFASQLGFVAQVVAFAFGLAASSLFPAIFMGIFFKAMNKEGAIAGMVSGLVFTFGYIFYFKLMNPGANVAENWLFGISPEGIGVIGMLINFGVAIAVASVTKGTPVEIRKLVDSIRVPRGAGEAHAH